MIPNHIPTKNIILEMHDRSPSLIVGTFELMDNQDVEVFLKALQSTTDADRGLNQFDLLSEENIDDHELQELLAGRLHQDITAGTLDLEGVSEAMREDFIFRLDAYLYQAEPEVSM